MFRVLPLLAAVLLAASSQPARALAFDEALARAALAPDVEADREALEVHRRTSRRMSSLAHNPELGMAPGFRQETSAWGPEGQAYVRQTFNIAGLSGARHEAAARETRELGDRLAARLLSRQLEAAEGWTRLWAAEREHELAHEELPMAQTIVERVRRATEAGALTSVDLAEAEGYLAESRLRTLDAEGAAYEAAVALGQTLGAADLPRTDGPLPAPALDDAELRTLTERAANTPAVAAVRAAALSARARARETVASRGTELHLGLAGGTEREGPFVAATLGFTLPLFDRGEREAAGQLAAAAQLDGDARKAATSAHLEMLDALHELEHSAERLAELRDRLLPAHARAADLRERLAAAGETTTFDLLVARRLVVATRARLARAEADHAFARAKIRLHLQALVSESP